MVNRAVEADGHGEVRQRENDKRAAERAARRQFDLYNETLRRESETAKSFTLPYGVLECAEIKTIVLCYDL